MINWLKRYFICYRVGHIEATHRSRANQMEIVSTCSRCKMIIQKRRCTRRLFKEMQRVERITGERQPIL